MNTTRYVPPEGALLEVTCRTIQGRLLLQPTTTLQQIVVGVLQRAQSLYPEVKICNAVVLANHYHLLLRVPDARTLACFMAFVNGNLSRKLGPLVDWSGPLWARRYDATLVADDEESQVRRLVYLLAHGVKEGLVRDPRQWPGLHGATALTRDGCLEGIWIDGTAACRDRVHQRIKPDDAYRTPITLQLAKLPCWEHLDWEQIAQRVEALLETIIADGRAQHRRVMGPKRVQQQDPHRRVQKPIRGHRPLVHASSQAVRRRIREAYAAFLAAYRSASALFLSGQLDAPFPAGSCRPPGPWMKAVASG